MRESELRQEICRVGASLFDRGYVHGTAGNISVSLGDGYLITPTDACLGFLDPGQLAKVSLDGVPLSGDRPSKTLALHRKIYEADPQARCVVHTHSTHLVAATLSRTWNGEDLLPPITPYFVMKVGHVPVIPYGAPGDPSVAANVGLTIATRLKEGRRLRAVMLERLGPNVWHATPAQAMAVLEELEETAKLWLMTKAAPLTQDALEQLRLCFNADW